VLNKFDEAFTRYTRHPDFGRLLLRLTFGILMLFHGVAKVNHGVDWISAMLEAKDYPDLSPRVFISEKLLRPC
jgi:putative oxidoreductase